MIVYELVGTEQHAVYQTLAAENLARQYDFLRSMVQASLSMDHPLLSIEIIKALNYHVITCLHVSPGEFRPCPVSVGGVPFGPEHFQVPAQMQMFTNQVNRRWSEVDAVTLAAFVLWRLNAIHPFVNGNGRTARAACHLVLCMKLGGWLPGDPILPELIRANRPEYVQALKAADASQAAGSLDLSVLHAFLSRLLEEQMASANPPAKEAPQLGA